MILMISKHGGRTRITLLITQCQTSLVHTQQNYILPSLNLRVRVQTLNNIVLTLFD